MKLQTINKLLINKYIRIWTKSSKFESTINIFSVFITTLCVSAIIIILSVNNGFKNNIVEILTDFNGHKRIYNKNYSSLSENDYISISSLYEKKLKITRFLTKECVIKSKKFSEGMLLFAINENDYLSSTINKYITNGNITDSTIVIGDLFLDKYDVDIGEYLSIFTLNNEGVEQVYKFSISGSFRTNIPDYDSHIIFCNSALLNNQVDYDFFQLNTLDESIDYTYLENNFKLIDASEINLSFFNWLSSYDNPINLLVFFIIIISILNVLNNNYYIIYYKRKQIILLQILGMNKHSLKSIIIARSIFSTFIGCVSGVIFAYLLLLLESHYHFIRLPSYVYFIDSLPIYINYNYIAFILPYMFIVTLVSSFLNYHLIKK